MYVSCNILEMSHLFVLTNHTNYITIQTQTELNFSVPKMSRLSKCLSNSRLEKYFTKCFKQFYQVSIDIDILLQMSISY